MDGLSRCLASPVPFTVGGVTGLLRPLTLARIGVCEAYLLSLRTTPADVAEESISNIDLHPEVAKALWWKAYEDVKADKALRYVSRDQLQKWLNTFAGCYFTGWLCLRKSFKHFRTLESSREYFSTAPVNFARDFLKARERVSGTDLLSNLEWPEDGEGKSDKRTPWKRIFRNMADAHGFSPREVGKLTMWSLYVFTAKEETLGGSKTVGLNEIAAYSGRSARKLR